MFTSSPAPFDVVLYDTTLRDGGQTIGVDFSVSQKNDVARLIDRLGFGYVEAGWPGANPTDDAFFAAPPALSRAKLTAFGMTRRKDRTPEKDPQLNALLASPAQAVCLVGKSWREQAEVALGVTAEENLAMIRESVAAVKQAGKEALFDAEHFFDGFKRDEAYALETLQAALEGGADWLVLCETNGGSFPHEVRAVVERVREALPFALLGFHAHNDRGCATASSLEAVRAGCAMIQGTLGGLGERCGNADLVTIAPNLMEMGYDVGVSERALKSLTEVSRHFAKSLGRDVPEGAPYVGERAFAHKGGLHVSAVQKNPRFYEHTAPERVGNRRKIAVSKQAGLASLHNTLQRLGIPYAGKEDRLAALLQQVKAQAERGTAYDTAEASFGVLALEALHGLGAPFTIKSYVVKSANSLAGANDDETAGSHAQVLVEVGGLERFAESAGEGPVHALDLALRQALLGTFPLLENTKLVNFKVGLLSQTDGTAAQTHVEVTSADESGAAWTTTGVSRDIVKASLKALSDAYVYKLNLGKLKSSRPAAARAVTYTASVGEEKKRLDKVRFS